MKKIIPIILCLHSTFLLSQIKAKVVGIKDGDTVVVPLEGNKQKVLRLADVDCPESGQPFGKKAKQFTSSQVFGKNIEFYEINKDRYDRTIAKIFYDSILSIQNPRSIIILTLAPSIHQTQKE